MVTVDLGMAAGLSDLFRYRAAIAATLGLDLLPFGKRLRSKEESKSNEHRWTAKLALRSWQFWLLFFARIFAASGTTVIVTHQVAHVVDVGYSKLLAASIFGLAGITSSFGRVVFGFIADLLSKQAAYTLNILMTLVGVGALMLLHDPTQNWLLYVYVIFFGICFGSRAVIFSALTADIFSGKGFGSILGYSTVAVGIGGALGSWLGGAFYDWTGAIWFHLRFRLLYSLAPTSAFGWCRYHRWRI